MKQRPNGRALAAMSVSMLAFASTIAGCSGGGSGEPGGGDAIDAGGAPSSVFVAGDINAFGSVIVDGVRYETSGAEIIVGGEPATEQALRVGQAVRISAVRDGATLAAQKVAYDENVRGPVELVDTGRSRITVLGQPVVVDPGTSLDKAFSPRSIEGLSVSDVVEVSGFVNANGEIVASRISPASQQQSYAAAGRVDSLDTAATTFQVNGLTVNYAEASLDGFADQELAEGQQVRAEAPPFSAGGSFDATRVTLEGSIFGSEPADDADITLEGFVTRFVSAAEFDVASLPATTDGNTQFEEGTVADLVLDARVQINGRLDDAGRLAAAGIEFEREGQIEIEATVDSVDPDLDQLTMLGITVQLTPETRMEDDSSLELRIFTIADINVGDRLEVRGHEQAAGTSVVTVQTLERDDDDGDDEMSIQGFATDVVEPGFVILGLPIDTDDDTEFDDLDRATFFASGEGMLVEVEGSFDGSRLLASEIELEDND